VITEGWKRGTGTYHCFPLLLRSVVNPVLPPTQPKKRREGAQGCDDYRSIGLRCVLHWDAYVMFFKIVF